MNSLKVEEKTYSKEKLLSGTWNRNKRKFCGEMFLLSQREARLQRTVSDGWTIILPGPVSFDPPSVGWGGPRFAFLPLPLLCSTDRLLIRVAYFHPLWVRKLCLFPLET